MNEPVDVFDVSHIGVWCEPTAFEVTREGTVAYAEATNDPHPAHTRGTLAPPLFAVVPPFVQLATVTMEPVPPHLMLRILHGEHDIRVHRPIVAGDSLLSRAKVVGIHGKSSGVVVTTLVETRDSSGGLVNEQYFAGFFRGGRWPHEEGEPFPPHELESALRETEPFVVRSQKIDADQTLRYAEASGDPMPIHTDDELARSLGFPGIIVHGLCTMAMTSQVVIEHGCPEDPSRLKRIAVRFSAVGRPGQEITTRLWSRGTNEGRDVLAFETTNDEGQVLIKDGLAEIAR